MLNLSLSAPAKLGFLRRLVSSEAQSILSTVESDYRTFKDKTDIPLLCDYKIQGEILAKYPSDDQIITYFGNSAAVGVVVGDAQCKKIRVEHIIREAIHRIKLLIFGDERLGHKSFIQLKRTMTSMKIGPNCDIKSWSKRMNTFQEYLPNTLWVAGAKEGKWPTEFDEERKREILEFALAKEYTAKLNSVAWCLSENSYDRSIAKIKEVEPEILSKLREREAKINNDKAIAELQVQAGIRVPTKTSSLRSGRPSKYNKDKTQSKPKTDGKPDANGYYLCANCGKTHKGVCRKPVPGATTDQNTTPRKECMTKKATRNYIKPMVASKSKKKIRKGRGKRRYSSDNSDSKSSSSEGTRSWRRGMTGAEQMHMIAAARLDPDDSDIEFDPEDERRYRKQAKKWSRSRGKRRRR